MTQRWARTFNIPHDMMTLCDWSSFYCNFELHSPHEQQWFTKYNARLLPIGKNLKRRRHSQTQACHCCQEDEDHDHIIRCTHSNIGLLFGQHFEDIHDHLEPQAHPVDADGISSLLRFYLCPSILDTSGLEKCSAIQNQLKLGWAGSILCGTMDTWLDPPTGRTSSESQNPMTGATMDHQFNAQNTTDAADYVERMEPHTSPEWKHSRSSIPTHGTGCNY